MKFINYLETIAGVDIYPLISLLIFFIFFSLLTFWALRANKKYISHMKNIPINNNDNQD